MILALLAALSLAQDIPSAGADDKVGEEDERTLLNRPDARAEVRLVGELGFLAVARHTIEIGEGGSRIDYVKEGGQDNLFAVARLSGELAIGRHTIVFLYQPLNIVAVENARRDLVRSTAEAGCTTWPRARIWSCPWA